MARGVSVLLLVVTATLWASVLGVLGLWLMFEGPTVWPAARWLCVVGGVVAALAGGLVFACFAADRIAPGAWKPAVWAAEISASVVVFLGVSWLVLVGAWVVGRGLS